jgi:hypothetical protein
MVLETRNYPWGNTTQLKTSRCTISFYSTQTLPASWRDHWSLSESITTAIAYHRKTCHGYMLALNSPGLSMIRTDCRVTLGQSTNASRTVRRCGSTGSDILLHQSYSKILARSARRVMYEDIRRHLAPSELSFSRRFVLEWLLARHRTVCSLSVSPSTLQLPVNKELTDQGSPSVAIHSC